MIKLLLSPRTKRGLSRAGLRQHLEHVHGPLCMAHEEIGGRFTRYIHHYTCDGYDELLGAHLMPDRDVVTCIYFKDEADLKSGLASDTFKQHIGPDEDNFRELAGSIGFNAQEWVVRRQAGPVHRKLFVFRRVPGSAEEVAAQWAAHLAAGLGSDPASPVASCTVNSARSSYADCAFNQIDELGLRAGGDVKSLMELYTGVARREFGALDYQALVTEPKVFKDELH